MGFVRGYEDVVGVVGVGFMWGNLGCGFCGRDLKGLPPPTPYGA